MSLNNIQLPAVLMESLYGKSLYDLTGETQSIDQTQSVNISFLGSNQKKIAIIVNSGGAIYLTDDELHFLMGILTACQLSMADIALVNISKNPGVHHTRISEQLNAEKVFLFGIEPGDIDLPLQFPHYQIQHFNNQVFLSSVSLLVLQSNKEEKLKLWNCLKKVFAL